MNIEDVKKDILTKMKSSNESIDVLNLSQALLNVINAEVAEKHTKGENNE